MTKEFKVPTKITKPVQVTAPNNIEFLFSSHPFFNVIVIGITIINKREKTVNASKEAWKNKRSEFILLNIWYTWNLTI